MSKCSLWRKRTHRETLSTIFKLFQLAKSEPSVISTIHSKACLNTLIVISANIEGLSSNKTIMHPYHQNCVRGSIVTVCVHKKHIDPHTHNPRFLIIMIFVAKCPHKKYRSVVLIHKDLKVNSIYVHKHGHVELFSAWYSGTLYVQTPE